MNSIKEQINKRTKWFMHDRFGLFLHYGIYAIPATGEWSKSAYKWDNEYYQRYFDEFNPTEFDARKWAKAAKNAGMKYAVLTAKHHDGFCLFDSKLTDYKITNTKFKRDLIREYIEAFRDEGLKVGLYYSLIDWHHPDYPHYTDTMHPMSGNEAYKDIQHDFDKYIEYYQGQVEELCRNYGKIDIFWFDFSYGDMRCEKWNASKLMTMVRTLQPEAIVDNRLEGSGEEFGSILSAEPTIYSGDFASPEQMLPEHGIIDVNGDPVPWEACITSNGYWGYAAQDKNYKSAKLIVKKLVECVSKGGNLLLNVGPDAKGNFPKQALKLLEDVGEWMNENSDSIYGCTQSKMPKPEWGRYTQKGNKLYAHIYEQSIGPLGLLGLPTDKIKKIRILADNSELKPVRCWLEGFGKNSTFVNFGNDVVATYPLPNEIDTVLEIEMEKDFLEV